MKTIIIILLIGTINGYGYYDKWQSTKENADDHFSKVTIKSRKKLTNFVERSESSSSVNATIKSSSK